MKRRRFLQTLGTTSAAAAATESGALDNILVRLLEEFFPLQSLQAMRAPLLAMRALGVGGLQADLENGNHLRWQVNPHLGFPSYGFDLFRREHRPGTLNAIAPRQYQLDRYALPDVYRTVRVSVRSPSRVLLRARYAGAVVAQAGLVPDANLRATAILKADVMDDIELPAAATLVAIHGVEWRQESSLGWTTPLNGPQRICLPLNEPAYPCSIGTDPWALAESRLRRSAADGTMVPYPDSARYQDEFEKLHAELKKCIASNGNNRVRIGAAADDHTSVRISPRQLVLLASIDPNVARMLGLLAIDRAAVTGTPYDYKIQGYWQYGDGKNVTTRYVPDESQNGTRLTRGAVIRGAEDGAVLFPTAAAAGVEVGPSGPGLAGRWTGFTLEFLALPRDSIVKRSINTPYPLAISFPDLRNRPAVDMRFEPVAQLVLMTVSVVGAVQARAFDPYGNVVATASVQSNGVAVQLRVAATSIHRVVLQGPAFDVREIVWEAPANMQKVVNWICFDVRRGAATALPTPSNVATQSFEVGSADDADFARPSTMRHRRQMAVGIGWDVPSEELPPGANDTILYHVYRRALGNGSLPPGLPALNDPRFVRVSEELDTSVSPARVIPSPIRPVRRKTPAQSTALLPWLWKEAPRYFIDEEIEQRWNAYAVEGYDMFGRRSNRALALQGVVDDRAPPPPLNVRARFVESSTDPFDTYHDPQLAALVPAGGGVVVSWDWSAKRYRQAPDTREFRVYTQLGKLNAFQGTVTNVIAGAEQSDITVQLSSGALAAGLTDAWIRIGDVRFTVLSSTTGATPVLKVRNRRLQQNAGQWASPPLGDCVIGVGGGGRRAGITIAADPNYKNYRDPVTWATRAVTVPMIQPPEGRITNVDSDSLSGTITANEAARGGLVIVTTDRHVVYGEELLTGAQLNVGRDVYEIRSVTPGPNTRMTLMPAPGASDTPNGTFTVQASDVLRIETDIPTLGSGLSQYVGGTFALSDGELRVMTAYDNGGTMTFAVERETDVDPEAPLIANPVARLACAWYPSYQVAFAVPSLAAPDGGTTAYGAVGVSAADDRADKVDARGDAARRGNEGAVCAPRTVARASTAQAVLPQAPSFIPNVASPVATRPDFHGRSYCTLRWPPSTTQSLHLVFRAEVAGIFAQDCEQRRNKTGYYSADQFDDDPGFSTWFIAYTARAENADITDMSGLATDVPLQKRLDGAWAEWAARFYKDKETDAPFVKALAERQGNESAFMQVSPQPFSAFTFRDTHSGKKAGRFVYRIRRLTMAGKPTTFSQASAILRVPSGAPPRSPLVAGVTAGDRKATVVVSHVPTNAAKYRLYRAEFPEHANDVRHMVKGPDVTGPTTSGPLALVDTGLTGGKEYFYRVVAIDADNNVSSPSAAFSVRVFDKSTPAAPELQASRTGADVTLSWPTGNTLRTRVQRRSGTSPWRPVSPWIAVGVTTFVDRSAPSGAGYDYRLEIQSASGVVGPITAVKSVPT